MMESEFIERLKEASKVKLTADQRFEQKVSFIYSSFDGQITKDDIRKFIREQTSLSRDAADVLNSPFDLYI